METVEPVEVSGHQATLRASVNPGGLITTYHFVWGPETPGSHTTAERSAGGGAAAVAVSAPISGLEPVTWYFARINAGNAATGGVDEGGTHDGGLWFRTTAAPPIVTVENNPTPEAGGKVILHGTVNPQGAATTYRFEWGTSEAYGSKTEGSAGSGTSPVSKEASISGLKGKTPYYFRLFAQNEKGTAEATGSFSTPNWSPTVTTEGADHIEVVEESGRATLHGTVNPNGFSTTYKFEYGIGSYEHTVEGPGAPTGSSPQEVWVVIKGIKGLKTYKYRLLATNEGNGYKQTNDGGERKFETPDWRPAVVTEAASKMMEREATLNGTVNPKGFSSSYHFEYVPAADFSQVGYAAATSVPVPDAAVGSGEAGVKVNQPISGLLPGTSYHFRLVATSQEGTSYGEDASFKTDATPPTYQFSFGSKGSGDGQFEWPAGAAVDAQGDLWVVDEDNRRLQKFNEAGVYQAKFGSYGTGNGQFLRPTDVAIDAKGNLWVTDPGYPRVQVFNEAGEYLFKFGSGGEGIAIDSKGNAWIADTRNGRLQEFNEKGEFIRVVGSKGTGEGQLDEPTGIDVGPGGKVWVADWGANRVSVFGEGGEFVRQFGTSGKENGQFERPDVIDVDSNGGVWVGDQGNNRIQQFDQAGQYVTKFGTPGTGDGQFNLRWPIGIATDSKGRIWIADSGNNRVQRWGY